MEKFIDIHSHILPGIDDGAKSHDEALRMLRIAVKNNIKVVIATPHYISGEKNASSEKVKKRLALLNELVHKNNLHIDIVLGNEIYYRSSIPMLLNMGEINTLAGSKYVLVEFNPMKNYEYIRDAVYKLLADGFIPVLAHAERYVELMQKKELLKELINMGACIQINAGTICGKMGRAAKQDAIWLLKKGYVHFVATDAHDSKKRTPCFNQAAKIIKRKFGKEMVEKLLVSNPEKILRDEYIDYNK